MGIREYFKQHPEGEDLKLQNMVIKEKELKSELLFDAEKELKSSDWHAMRRALESYANTNDFKMFSYLADIMKTLFSDKIKESDFSDDVWSAVKEHVENFDGWHDIVPFDDYRRVIIHLKRTFPEKFETFKLNNKLHEHLLEMLKREDFSDFYIRLIEGLRVVYSEEPKQIVHLNNFWNKKIEDLEYRIFELKKGNLKYAYGTRIILMDLLKIFPERAKKTKLDMDIWKILLNIFRNHRFGISDTWHESMDLKIISENFVIGEEKKKYYVEKSKRPERKSF